MEVINRLLGLLLGLALLAAGLLIIVETAVVAAGRSGWLVDREVWGEAVGQLQWDDRNLVVVATIVAVLGLALALLQLWPARPRFLPLSPRGQARRDAIDGRGLQELLRRAAAQDHDVMKAYVAVRRRKAKVKVRTPSDADSKAVRARVKQQVRARVDALDLKRPISPRVKVERSRERVR